MSLLKLLVTPGQGFLWHVSDLSLTLSSVASSVIMCAYYCANYSQINDDTKWHCAGQLELLLPRARGRLVTSYRFLKATSEKGRKWPIELPALLHLYFACAARLNWSILSCFNWLIVEKLNVNAHQVFLILVISRHDRVLVNFGSWREDLSTDMGQDDAGHHPHQQPVH